MPYVMRYRQTDDDRRRDEQLQLYKWHISYRRKIQPQPSANNKRNLTGFCWMAWKYENVVCVCRGKVTLIRYRVKYANYDIGPSLMILSFVYFLCCVYVFCDLVEWQNGNNNASEKLVALAELPKIVAVKFMPADNIINIVDCSFPCDKLTAVALHPSSSPPVRTVACFTRMANLIASPGYPFFLATSSVCLTVFVHLLLH